MDIANFGTDVLQLYQFKKRVYTMATQFVSAFLIIGLLVFLGIAMTVGVINSKARQVKTAVPSDRSSSNASE